MAEAYEAQVSASRALNGGNQGLPPIEENFEDLDDDFLDLYTMNPRQRLWHQVRRARYRLLESYSGLPLWKKIAIGVVFVMGAGFMLGMLIFHKRILKAMVAISDQLREKWYTPLLFASLVFLVSFPPLIGFSLLSTSVGLIYGVSFRGWITLFIGSVCGSIVAFALFKTLLRSQAERLMRANSKFEALTSILQDNDSYFILALIRLCPFPYSFTNGAIAGVYGVTIQNFSIASVLTSPKLVLYLFIGARLKNMGETDSPTSRLFDFLSIVATGLVLFFTAWLLYYRAKRRYSELRREQQLDVSFDNVF
ncbi:LAFE_0F01222g1_1 [Lachancea fermentati]|uniref:Golgi apparatus membrane protein TVP38 n=1 Tax=Lachancea fermentati TaxID=4955 RepID=A0A1G4MEC7_LACFM|nr:LAFE_0F01222g1_1 [Lachancea fermentati]